uniref:Uncharacterized protein n=1 Tax=Panagrolaimus superbus TaxID=310955 RepID=A0A914XSJ7_9BILA
MRENTPVSSQEAAAQKNDSEDSVETDNDKPIPAKANVASVVNDQDTNESSDTDDEAPGQKPSENAHKHREHSNHLENVVEDEDSKTKIINDKTNSDKIVKSVDDNVINEKSQKVDDDKTKAAAAALEADKPAATSESEEEEAVESDNRKPLADNTYPKAPAATVAEDRQQQSRESSSSLTDKNAKVIVGDKDSEVDDDSNQKNEEVPAPEKPSGTLTQEENEGVANLTEDKQMDIRKDGEDGLAAVATTTTMKSPNAAPSISVSFSLIFLSIIFFLLQ